MSRRGGGRQSDANRQQPSPVPSQYAGRGRGRGRGGRPSPTPHAPSYAAPSPAPVVVPPPTPAVVPPSAPASTPSSSVPAAVPTAESLIPEVEKTLTLQSSTPPSSSRAIRFPNRPGFGTLGMKVRVRANHFQVQLAERDLHHYDVSISPEITSKKVCRQVIGLLIKMHQESMLGKRIPAYDGRKSLYTAGPLPFTTKEFLVKLVDEDEHGSSCGSAPARKKREREFKVTIRFASKPDIHHLFEFLRQRQLDCPNEVIQALDVVLRATPSERYDVVGRSFFSPELGDVGSLGSGTEYWRGYYQSLRPTQMGLSLNIDVSARAFYEPIYIPEFIDKHFRFNPNRPLSDPDRIKIKKALRGVKVELTNGKTIRTYKVTGVTREPLRQLRFTLDDNRNTSVVEYFNEKYNINLRILNLPALQAGSDSKPIYLPMELCRIAPRQRYTRRLNEEQVTALLKATCQRPQARENNIRQTVRQNNFTTDKFARDFGIQVREDLALVDARVLPPPRLQYHATGKESVVEPRMGQWNMIDKKMVDGGTVQYWSCLNFSVRGLRDMPPAHFCAELIKMCNSKGMRFNPEAFIPIKNAQPSQIEAALENIQKQCAAAFSNKKVEGKLQLLIIILPDVKGSYGKIKRICETELGIVSQCCQPRQVLKLNKQYLENVALKINVKVGGRNTFLCDAIAKRVPQLTDIPTLILGADVTHPQPGEDSSPSIAAVVGSTDWPEVMTYRGIVSAQMHREEIIQDLYKSPQDSEKGTAGGMIRELLLAFYRSKRLRPLRIIFYRDGVSEGQFSQVLLWEMDAIRKACASLEEGYLPKVTFIVVQKRHHTKLFAADHNARNQTDKSGNIMPGTVVDTAICHPREFDFFLNSHAGIQGTSRPAHYHVLYDENNFSANELQSLTNNLCYTYARCTRSVSIVPPAYYAHLAAFRARYYIEGETERDSGTGNRSVNFVVRLPSVKDNVKDVMYFC